MFNSILESSSLTVISVIICITVSIILGLVIALVHMKTSTYTKNFVVTLSLLPMLVQVVMLMVNGNLGTSVAVLGAFSLIRFRSIPGNSREITSIFLAMAIGLSVGMGQIYFAILITIISSIMLLLFYKTSFGEKTNERILKVAIPEDLDYEEVFNESLLNYTNKYNLEKIKTINMGSMFELTYRVQLRNEKETQKLINDIRIKNGNLKISLSRNINEESL